MVCKLLFVPMLIWDVTVYWSLYTLKSCSDFIVNKIITLFHSAVFYTWFVYDGFSGEYDPALSVFLEVGIAAKVL